LWEVVIAEPPPDLRALLPTLEVPTLVVTGDHDRTIAPSWSRQTAAAIPGARFAQIEGCGHTPQEERPHALLEVLRGFLAGLDPDAATPR
ncbi:MAG: alpha/beta fold hydrolase, partial [Nitriliruptoraceae bacterium]